MDLYQFTPTKNKTMKNKKLKLDQIEVKSFITQLENKILAGGNNKTKPLSMDPLNSIKSCTLPTGNKLPERDPNASNICGYDTYPSCVLC